MTRAGGIASAAAAAAGRRRDRRPRARRSGRTGASPAARDVDPATYGQAAHPTTDQPAGDRDAWEFALVRGALTRGLPVLGICRGAQVLNVALGGTLHQHLPDVLGHIRHQAGNAVFTTSGVRTVPGTRLAALIGESSDAQCYHHQAIDRLGQGLVISAQDGADGVIEAVEMPGRRTSFWPCSGIPRSDSTICGCSPASSRPRAAHATERVRCGGPLAGERSDRERVVKHMSTTTLINPATEEVLRTVELLDVAAVDDAVARAKAAQRAWAKLAPGRAGRRHCGPSPRSSTPTSTNWPPSRSPTPGTSIGNAEWEAGPRPRRAAVLLGQPGTLVRQADSRRRRARRHLQRAARAWSGSSRRGTSR